MTDESPDTVGLTWEDVRRIGLTLPRVESVESTDTPSLNVNGKMFARLYKDRANVVLRMRKSERAKMVAEKPDVYHFTQQYAGVPYVLVRLVAVTEEELAAVLRLAWKEVAG